MAEAKVFGFQCKLFYKPSTTWVELTPIINATLNLAYEEAEATTRGSGGVKETEPSLLNVSIDANLQWRNDNTQCEALWDAFMGRNEITLMALTGAATDPEARGVTGKFKITSFPQKQELANMVEHDIVFKPCAGSTLAAATGTAP